MKSLRDTLLGIKPVEQQSLTMPDGRKVYAGELTGLEWVECRIDREKWADENGEAKRDPFWDARVVMRSLNDGAGNLVFKEGDEAIIMGLPKHVLEAITKVVNAVNYGDAILQDELKKSSPETQTSPSPGDSPATLAA